MGVSLNSRIILINSLNKETYQTSEKAGMKLYKALIQSLQTPL